MPEINVAQMATVLSRKIPALLSDLFALPSSHSVSKLDRQRLRQKLEEMLPLLQEMERLKTLQLPSEEHARRVLNVVDAFIRSWAPTRIPKRMHALDWMRTQLRRIVAVPISPLVRGTRYRSCQMSVRRLIIRLRRGGKLHEALCLLGEDGCGSGRLYHPASLQGGRRGEVRTRFDPEKTPLLG